MARAGKEFYERGLACERAGDVSGAFEAFRRSAKADPGVAAPYVGLSRVLTANHQRAAAIGCLERATACEPANHAVHTLLGNALTQDGQLERGRRAYEEALRLKADSLDALFGLAGVCEDLGERQQAVTTYRRLLDHAPGDAQGLAGLLGVAEGEALDAAIRIADSQLLNATDRDAALIGYALGKALAGRGEHDAAFAGWNSANAARRRVAGPFDRDYFDQRIDRLIEIFSADFFAARRGWGDASERPVFVVGLPRSGTTLTEQILAGHPDVFGAGELDLLTDMATGTPDRLGRSDPPWPQAALELSQALVAEIARDHLGRLAALAPDPVLRVIDKQPLNFWHLGLVALTFPSARIVNCTRDIRDNGLSIYAENFSPEQRWSTDLTDIAYYWQGYRRLMAHWQETTGLQILTVEYGDTVADLETQARTLTEFLGLPWNPTVLDFHQTERAVQTPSRWQVRRPLYTSSSGRWRHYRGHLDVLIQARGETIERGNNT